MELRACNEMNRPLPGIGGSVEDIKPEREEMDDDNKDDDSETSLDNRALDGERLEATDEKDLATLVEEETAAKAKGKEKALSDGSVESCNSAGLLSRGKKRPGFEQQLILGSKRLKTSQECFGSTSKLKQDSSFMNWISNMTKGIWKGNEEELSPCCRNTGFQSIYCPKKRGEDASNDANAASLLKLPEKCLNTKGDHLSSSGNEVGPVANDSQKAILPIVSSLRLESSEAMASLFARRLESLKHICFYCGKKGHRLQDCLEVTDTELRDLVQNINARNGREEASSLCIKCFQLSPPYSSGAEDKSRFSFYLWHETALQRFHRRTKGRL